MSTKKAMQTQIENLTRRAVGAETHGELLEQALAARTQAAAPPAPAPAPAPAPPPPPSIDAQYRELQRSNPYLASEFLLNNEAAICAERASQRK